MKAIFSRIALFITLAALFAASVMFSYGQTLAFGARITPSHIPAASVKNPSPSNIYGQQGLNLNFGIYALKYFDRGRMGIKAGLEQGGFRFVTGVDAPRNAFGTGNGGDAQINILFETNPFTYNSLTISPTYKLPVKGRFLEFTAGPSLRTYNGYPKDGYNEIMLAFNRSAPYDPNNPSHGAPDIRVTVPNMDHFYLSFPVSVDYVVRASKRTQLKFGIMHNISKPLDGELEVQMYGKMYSGSFRHRTGFWGANVQYEWLSKKTGVSYKKHVPGPERVGKYRKAVFIETYKKPGFLSANYDMRLKKDSNEGFGFTAGAGLGNAYLTDVQDNNTAPDRRRLALPVAINYIVGAKRHGAEIGVGVTPQIPLNTIRDGFEYNGTFFSARLGYRFQPLREGFIGRIAWVPTAEKIPVYSGYEINWANVGVSVGYSFK